MVAHLAQTPFKDYPGNFTPAADVIIQEEQQQLRTLLSYTALVVPVALEYEQPGSKEGSPPTLHNLWLHDCLVEHEGDSSTVVTDIRVPCKAYPAH